MKYSLVCELKK